VGYVIKTTNAPLEFDNHPQISASIFARQPTIRARDP